MNLSEVLYTQAVPIESYGPGFFRIAGEVIEGGALIHAAGAKGWGGFEDTATVLAMKDKIDFILLGTGDAMTPVPAAFRMALQEAEIGIEPMATPSACRTYNVLVSEGRRVAAVLVPIEG
ncbi:Mth938-like domain-containing protein [uncultured Shimia sp.]|uniref:Mth938-like domain-containing protein n=1 Tax=uncultured Shimia sp. TaxID=573152 RepID=UPI0026200FCF|nr:Mth938-like domain-containing protein [uncultured Shimia sp.]